MKKFLYVFFGTIGVLVFTLLIIVAIWGDSITQYLEQKVDASNQELEMAVSRAEAKMQLANSYLDCMEKLSSTSSPKEIEECNVIKKQVDDLNKQQQ